MPGLASTAWNKLFSLQFKLLGWEGWPNKEGKMKGSLQAFVKGSAPQTHLYMLRCTVFSFYIQPYVDSAFPSHLTHTTSFPETQEMSAWPAKSFFSLFSGLIPCMKLKGQSEMQKWIMEKSQNLLLPRNLWDTLSGLENWGSFPQILYCLFI